jgi:hypothetical protein
LHHLIAAGIKDAKRQNCSSEAALRMATRTDAAFVEAWYNLGDLLDLKPPSNASAKRFRLRPTMSMQCLTWLGCCNAKINTPRRQNWRRFHAIDRQSQ